MNFLNLSYQTERALTVLIRFLALLFSIIVGGCVMSNTFLLIAVSDSVKRSADYCIFAGDMNACNYGTAIPIMGIFGLFAIILFDTSFQEFTNYNLVKMLTTIEVIFTGLWAFLYFVGFCYLTNRWNRSGSTAMFTTWRINNARASIAFMFFSIFIWIAQFILAVKRYNEVLQGGRQNDDTEPITDDVE